MFTDLHRFIPAGPLAGHLPAVRILMGTRIFFLSLLGELLMFTDALRLFTDLHRFVPARPLAGAVRLLMSNLIGTLMTLIVRIYVDFIFSRCAGLLLNGCGAGCSANTLIYGCAALVY